MTHLSRRTATTRFSPEGCQKQTAPRCCQHLIRWDLYLTQAPTRWRHLAHIRKQARYWTITEQLAFQLCVIVLLKSYGNNFTAGSQGAKVNDVMSLRWVDWKCVKLTFDILLSYILPFFQVNTMGQLKMQDREMKDQWGTKSTNDRFTPQGQHWIEYLSIINNSNYQYGCW